jgi:hypothetical protein
VSTPFSFSEEPQKRNNQKVTNGQFITIHLSYPACAPFGVQEDATAKWKGGGRIIVVVVVLGRICSVDIKIIDKKQKKKEGPFFFSFFF